MGNYIKTDSPVGTIILVEEGGKLINLKMETSGFDTASHVYQKTPVLAETEKHLAEYFAGSRKVFDIDLDMRGTEFMLKDWAALLDIPYGETRSYKDIAAACGNPKACRAVGTANHRNPIAIIVPCHRVIGSDGSLTGYGGGLDMKEYLLKLEAEHASDG